MHVQAKDDLEAATIIANEAREWSKRLRWHAGTVTYDELRQLLDMIDGLASVAVRTIERNERK